MAAIASEPRAGAVLLLIRRFLLAPALFFLFFNSSAGASRDIVAELTDDYFEQGLLDYDHAMVLFNSHKCVHCSDFLPIFKMAADELIRNEPPVHSAIVDCVNDGKTVCQEEEVNHLPTVKIYRRGTLYDEYDGGRKVEDLVAYMRKLVGITSVELTLDDLRRFANSQKEVAVVAVLQTKGNLREKYFSLPAELSKDIRFGHITIDENKMAADSNVSYGVTLYHPEHMRSKFEPWEYSYATEHEGYDLLEFILGHRYGIAGIRGIRHVDDFAPPLVIVYFRFDLNLRAKMFSYWRNRILKVAKDYEHALNFAISPIDDFHHEFTKFGIALPSEEQLDTPLVFAILEDNSKYLMGEEFSIKAFDRFLRGVLHGTATPHLKSQPIPVEVAEKGKVGIVVANSFMTAVWENEEDVLLEFFAPWCAFCKELDGVLDELAKTLTDEDVAIFKMDATENEVPANFDVARFPSIYYVPKRDKHQPILYTGPTGSAHFGELLAFVAEHSTDGLTVGIKAKKTEL